MKRSHFVTSTLGFALAPILAQAADGTIGIFARTMSGAPPFIAQRADEQFPAASTIKLAIMLTAFLQEEARPGALDERITFASSELISGSEFMARQSGGARFSVRTLLRPMITLSDNTASNMLIDHFGAATINAVAQEAGMTRTRLGRKFLDFAAIVHHSDNLTTPADLGELLFQIERGMREGIRTVASPEHCRAMVRLLLGQTDRDGIPEGIPPSIRVANKTGEITGTRNDAAIIDPDGDSPYILVVMSRGVDDYARVYRAIHRIARDSWHHVAGSLA